MKYPFSPEILDAMPEKLVEIYRDLESWLLKEICSRLGGVDELNTVTLKDIEVLHSHWIPLREIEKQIRKTANLSRMEWRRLVRNTVKWNRKYYGQLMTKSGLTKPERLVDERDVKAIEDQTNGEFANLTRSMGFYMRGLNGRMALQPPGAVYQRVLDKMELAVLSGATSYSVALQQAIKELAASGLRTVSYESGRVDRLDVAVRRAIMTGIAQICDKYTVAAMKELDTDLSEVSAHRGARDKGTGHRNHKEWQGKVYSERDDDPKYPSIYEVCGLGEVDGLKGANCRHRRFAFVDGVSERTYTDEQLKNIDPPPIEYEGRTYTMYEATQKQREIERTVRDLERHRNALKEAGLQEDARNVDIKIRRLKQKYIEFSKTADLPPQWERMKNVLIAE